MGAKKVSLLTAVEKIASLLPQKSVTIHHNNKVGKQERVEIRYAPGNSLMPDRENQWLFQRFHLVSTYANENVLHYHYGIHDTSEYPGYIADFRAGAAGRVHLVHKNAQSLQGIVRDFIRFVRSGPLFTWADGDRNIDYGLLLLARSTNVNELLSSIIKEYHIISNQSMTESNLGGMPMFLPILGLILRQKGYSSKQIQEMFERIEKNIAAKDELA